MKRYCSIADLKIGNVFKFNGEPYAVYGVPVISQLRRIQINSSGPYYHVKVVNQYAQKNQVSLQAFDFVELIRG